MADGPADVPAWLGDRAGHVLGTRQQPGLAEAERGPVR